MNSSTKAKKKKERYMLLVEIASPHLAVIRRANLLRWGLGQFAHDGLLSSSRREGSGRLKERGREENSDIGGGCVGESERMVAASCSPICEGLRAMEPANLCTVEVAPHFLLCLGGKRLDTPTPLRDSPLHGDQGELEVPWLVPTGTYLAISGVCLIWLAYELHWPVDHESDFEFEKLTCREYTVDQVHIMEVIASATGSREVVNGTSTAVSGRTKLSFYLSVCPPLPCIGVSTACLPLRQTCGG